MAEHIRVFEESERKRLPLWVWLLTLLLIALLTAMFLHRRKARIAIAAEVQRDMRPTMLRHELVEAGRVPATQVSEQ